MRDDLRLGARGIKVGHDVRDARAVIEIHRIFKVQVQAAEQDLPEALCALAGEYFEGENVGRDENKAIDLYERAADLGNEDAKLCLSSIYLEKCNNEDDIKRAIEYLKEAAESGNGEACNNLGIVFEMGKGVPKDDREAIK